MKTQTKIIIAVAVVGTLGFASLTKAALAISSPSHFAIKATHSNNIQASKLNQEVSEPTDPAGDPLGGPDGGPDGNGEGGPEG